MSNLRTVGASEVRLRLDDAAILAVAAKIAANDLSELSVEDLAVVSAMRRAHPSAGHSLDELSKWLAAMDEGQLQGVVSNTKGVLHEMLFVQLENSDGDTIYAARFPATNHPGFDVSFADEEAGHRWVAQLKATDSVSYVREWLDRYPGGQILVTTEVAERLGIQGSGFSNEELTADTSRLVDHLVQADAQDAMWDYVPALGALSVAMVISDLHERVGRGDITRNQFNSMVARATGQRMARTLGLSVLIAIPGLNVLTAIGLIAGNLERSGVLRRFNDWVTRKSAQMDATRALELAVFTERIAIETAIRLAMRHRASEQVLSGKGEEYRRIYAEKLRETERALEGEVSLATREVLVYEDPDLFLMEAGDCGAAAGMVEEKIAQVDAERDTYLREAQLFLRDPANSLPFQHSLEGLVGQESAAIIKQAIFRGSYPVHCLQ